LGGACPLSRRPLPRLGSVVGVGVGVLCVVCMCVYIVPAVSGALPPCVCVVCVCVCVCVFNLLLQARFLRETQPQFRKKNGLVNQRGQFDDARDTNVF